MNIDPNTSCHYRRRNHPLFFFLRYLQRPRRTGNIAPSGPMVASAFARATRREEGVPVLEIGGGTGAVTRHLLGARPEVVEINPSFCALLRRKFPNLTVHESCAIEFLSNLTHRTGLICSIPLINNPDAKRLIDTISEQRERGLIAYCAVLTYGLRSPLRDAGFAGSHRAWCLLNVPPAFVWTYW